MHTEETCAAMDCANDPDRSRFHTAAPIRCAVCREEILPDGYVWTHAHGIGPDARQCGTGDGATAYPETAAHVHHGMLTYPTPENPGTDARAQIGPGMSDALTEYHGVRGMDGREYVAEGAAAGAWRIVRRGHYGLGAVVRSHT
jgi:hypothetical protein